MITFKQWLVSTGQLPNGPLKKRPKSAAEQKHYDELVKTVTEKLYESFYAYRLIDTRLNDKHG